MAIRTEKLVPLTSDPGTSAVASESDGVADGQLDCNGGSNDTAHVDGADTASIGCETVTPQSLLENAYDGELVWQSINALYIASIKRIVPNARVRAEAF